MPDRQFHLAAPPETLDDDPPIRELMTCRLIAISPDADIDVALRLLSSVPVRHLPVMDAGRCAGVIFEHDVLRHVAERAAYQYGRPILATDLYRRVARLSPTDRRSTAAEQMAKAGLDAVLVTEEDTLLGIVTASDVLRSIAEQHTCPDKTTE